MRAPRLAAPPISVGERARDTSLHPLFAPRHAGTWADGVGSRRRTGVWATFATGARARAAAGTSARRPGRRDAPRRHGRDLSTKRLTREGTSAIRPAPRPRAGRTRRVGPARVVPDLAISPMLGKRPRIDAVVHGTTLGGSTVRARKRSGACPPALRAADKGDCDALIAHDVALRPRRSTPALAPARRWRLGFPSAISPSQRGHSNSTGRKPALGGASNRRRHAAARHVRARPCAGERGGSWQPRDPLAHDGRSGMTRARVAATPAA